MITHVVSFQLADQDDRAEAVRRLQAMAAQIEQVLTLQAGADVVGDTGAADVALITTHEDVAGLKAYQAHPVHQTLLGWLGPRVTSRTVVDFPSPDPATTS